MTPPVLRITNVRKQYHGLRPLRLNDLSVDVGELTSPGPLNADDGQHAERSDDRECQRNDDRSQADALRNHGWDMVAKIHS